MRAFRHNISLQKPHFICNYHTIPPSASFFLFKLGWDETRGFISPCLTKLTEGLITAKLTRSVTLQESGSVPPPAERDPKQENQVYFVEQPLDLPSTSCSSFSSCFLYPAWNELLWFVLQAKVSSWPLSCPDAKQYQWFTNALLLRQQHGPNLLVEFQTFHW